MCLHKALGKILLLVPLIMLTACAGGGEGTTPSLNAGDIWDQMAVERQKPLPVNPKSASDTEGEENDSAETLYDWPGTMSPAPLSLTDREGLRARLRTGDKTYQTIRKALEAAFVALGKDAGGEADRQAGERTLQLHLSRLANLKSTMDRAITSLAQDQGQDQDEADQDLLGQSRRLVAIMVNYGDSLRRRLDDISQPQP